MDVSNAMLALSGFSMVAVFMTLIMTRRLSPLIALISVPILFGLLTGFAAELGPMMIDGIRTIAPTAVMLMFAILYFGLMIDTGLFDGIVERLLRLVRGDPVRIVVGTVLLASLVSLDGDGSTTYMITTAALLPLYRRIGLNPLIMACLIMLSSGVMNLTPWGGPTARAATALNLDATAVFLPLIPGMLIALAWLTLLGWIYGRAERKRLAKLGRAGLDIRPSAPDDLPADRMARACSTRLLAINATLTVALLALLIAGVLPLPALFMSAFCVAMVINFPRLEDQKARIAALAPNVLAVISPIFAAGIFTGILNGTGMVQQMSLSLLAAIPSGLGPYMCPLVALISLPMTFFVSNDAFYFGMLPVLAEAGMHYGLPPTAIASASLIGQPLHLLSPLVPSTYLLTNLSGVDFGDHQRFTFRWAVVTCAVLFAGSLVAGAFPFAL